jgi:hypothetical protein
MRNANKQLQSCLLCLGALCICLSGCSVRSTQADRRQLLKMENPVVKNDRDESPDQVVFFKDEAGRSTYFVGYDAYQLSEKSSPQQLTEHNQGRVRESIGSSQPLAVRGPHYQGTFLVTNGEYYRFAKGEIAVWPIAPNECYWYMEVAKFDQRLLEEAQ